MKRVLGLFIGCLFLVSACSESEVGWTLINREVADPTSEGEALNQGDVSYYSSSSGSGVRFVVNTDTRGTASSENDIVVSCDDLPTVVDAEIDDDSADFFVRWSQRGCLDSGNVAFTVVLEDGFPAEGMTISFPITPEIRCSGVFISAEQQDPISCPTE